MRFFNENEDYYVYNDFYRSRHVGISGSKESIQNLHRFGDEMEDKEGERGGGSGGGFDNRGMGDDEGNINYDDSGMCRECENLATFSLASHRYYLCDTVADSIKNSSTSRSLFISQNPLLSSRLTNTSNSVNQSLSSSPSNVITSLTSSSIPHLIEKMPQSTMVVLPLPSTSYARTLSPLVSSSSSSFFHNNSNELLLSSVTSSQSGLRKDDNNSIDSYGNENNNNHNDLDNENNEINISQSLSSSLLATSSSSFCSGIIVDVSNDKASIDERITLLNNEVDNNGNNNNNNSAAGITSDEAALDLIDEFLRNAAMETLYASVLEFGCMCLREYSERRVKHKKVKEKKEVGDIVTIERKEKEKKEK
jgi:hypothetical protein